MAHRTRDTSAMVAEGGRDLASDLEGNDRVGDGPGCEISQLSGPFLPVPMS